jgi:2-C-methyl-D-erythritol 4-phosphate cytidylyltransferase
VEGRRLSLALVVAAAGRGVRLDAGMPKQYVPLLGVPMLQRTLNTLSACGRVDALVVAVNPEDVDYCRQEIVSEAIGKVLQVVAGGAERAISVRNGLRALAETGAWDLVGVHDGARPLVTCEEIGRVVDALARDPGFDGAILAIPSTDTIKVVDNAGVITSTPDRRSLWRAQTPQIFRWRVLMDAYASPSDEALIGATDDAALVEALGKRVAVVEGSSQNFKVTERSDVKHAEQILAERRR